MPRINVEEEFWGDQRVERLKLLLGRFTAEGACLCAWRLGQKYWNGECRPIPKKTWEEAGMPIELISVGLVKEVDEGFYVAGSQEHFEWYKKRVEAGQLGGRASASKRQAPVEHPLSTAQASVKQKQPSSSSSSSSSSSRTIRTPVVTQPASSNFDFEAIYRLFPRKDGKTNGINICLKTIKTEQDFVQLEQAVRNYGILMVKQNTEKKHVKHFSTFMNCWRDYLDNEDVEKIKKETKAVDDLFGVPPSV